MTEDFERFTFTMSLLNPYRDDPKKTQIDEKVNKDNTQEISIDKSEGSECVPSLTVQSPPPCMCGNRCPAMENPEEQVCCRSELKWQQRYNADGQVKCILDCPNYRNILNIDHFRITKDILNSIFHDDDESDILNRRLRKAAYKSTAFFIRGHMGSGNRLVVPACAKAKIRELCPNPEGVPYTGHKWI